MKKFIKEILYAAHECGVCCDWSNKICDDIIDILKRDNILPKEPINEEELDILAKDYVKNAKPLVDGDCISCYKAGYRKARILTQK